MEAERECTRRPREEQAGDSDCQDSAINTRETTHVYSERGTGVVGQDGGRQCRAASLPCLSERPFRAWPSGTLLEILQLRSFDRRASVQKLHLLGIKKECAHHRLSSIPGRREIGRTMVTGYCSVLTESSSIREVCQGSERMSPTFPTIS